VLGADKRASTMSNRDVLLLSGRYSPADSLVLDSATITRWTSTRSFLARDVRCWLLTFDNGIALLFHAAIFPAIIPRFRYLSSNLRVVVRAIGPICVDCASSLNYCHFELANARIAYRATTLLLASIYFSSSLSLPPPLALSLSFSLAFISFAALKHSIRRDAINSGARRLSRAIASFVRSLAG